MASSGGRGRGPGGLTRAITRLGLLVVLGFGAGFMIGLVSEEPGLLVGHLRGRTESVPLEALVPGGDPGLPAVAAAGERSLPGAPEPAVHGVAEREAPREGPRPGEARVLPTSSAASPEARTVRPAVQAAGRAAPALAASRQGDERAAKADRSATRWAIQVGAFADQVSARGLADDLARKGYPVETIPSEGSARRWRVRVQPIEGEQSARRLAERLKREERLPTWVLPVEGRPGS